MGDLHSVEILHCFKQSILNKKKIIKSMYSKFKSIKSSDCPNANYIMRNGFYLPSGNTLSNRDIDDISKKLIKIYIKIYSCKC